MWLCRNLCGILLFLSGLPPVLGGLVVRTMRMSWSRKKNIRTLTHIDLTNFQEYLKKKVKTTGTLVIFFTKNNRRFLEEQNINKECYAYFRNYFWGRIFRKIEVWIEKVNSKRFFVYPSSIFQEVFNNYSTLYVLVFIICIGILDMFTIFLPVYFFRNRFELSCHSTWCQVQPFRVFRRMKINFVQKFVLFQ